MPVYLRRNANMSPPSGEPADLEDDPDSFVRDPEQVRDLLPQPFRMINKFVDNIIDDAWDFISNRENEKFIEASKIRAPQYECGIQLQQDTDNVTAMVDSKDGRYIILGVENGLSVIDAHTQHAVAHWKQDNVDITFIQVTMLSDQLYLLCTIDDLGSARLFALAGEVIYLLHNMNEQGDGAKVNAGKCEASADGDYVGVFFENPNMIESTLEVHKLPKDVWVKELENLVAKAAAKKEAAIAQANPPPPTEPPIEYSHSMEGPTPISENPNDDETRSQPSEEASSEGQSQVSKPSKPSYAPKPRAVSKLDKPGDVESPGSQKGEPQAYKFSAPTIVLKVKPPAGVNGVTLTSATQAVKTVDHTGEVIGQGLNHLLSPSHLEQRKAIFDQQHSQHISYLPKEEKHTMVQPTFHFLQPGRMLPHGLELPGIAGQPTAIAVWWTGQAQVLHYSLTKSAKASGQPDSRGSSGVGALMKKVVTEMKKLEHKPDLVWPMSSPVVASVTSPCTSLVGLALLNNNLVIWDWHMGLPRQIIHVTDSGKVTGLEFLDPAICPQDNQDAPYSITTSSYILVTCTEGQLFLVNSGMGNVPPPQAINLNIDNEDEIPTRIIQIDGIPELIVTCRANGMVYIHDIVRSHQLCQVTLPKTHQLSTPWEPTIAAGAGGQMLYLKGSLKKTAETCADENENTTLSAHQVFGFTLRSFPSLDKYRRLERPEVPHYVHSTIEKRVDSLLRERISQQGLRQVRMQQRWSQLKGELETIKARTNRAKSKPKSAYAASSIARTPMLIGDRYH